MVPMALGTQTGGSTIRPASFCGVVGFKPTFGRINRTGVKPGAESLDTIGLMARSVEDLDLMSGVLMGRTSALGLGSALPRIGMCRTHLWETALPESQAAFNDTHARLEATGALVREIALPAQFSRLSRARVVLSNYERARAMAHEWNRHREHLSAPMRAAIADGLKIPDDEHIATLELAGFCRREFGEVFGGVDVLIAPCVSGEAPRGLQSTGDTRLQDIWTVLHTPALTLPTHKGPNGLPIGIQLIARQYRDEMLLEAARWISRQLTH
jgi:amidase